METAQNKEAAISKNTGPEIVVLKFADSKVPVFKESRSKDYISYGEKNDYPEYLTFLFNKSAKHNAIINGKAKYIFGEGYENGGLVINRLGETINDITRKVNLDVEIYGGFRLEVIWNALRKIAEVYHVDYTSIRTGKEGGYFFKETWESGNRDTPEHMEAFNPANPVGSQIYAYNEYRPMVRYYPLPSYIGCNNYVETDIEISKFYLSAIRNGMNPSKMIQFFKGEPSEDKKREIDRRFGNKFAGAENAGNYILVFNDANGVNQTVKIDDLSGSELDKMFVELNKVCQQEIFSGHGITSPMLFGIKTEGQLGGSTELKTAYEIFINTYAKPKACAIDKELTYLLSFSNYPATYELRPTDPIGLQFELKDVINSLPKAFVFKNLGVPEEMWELPNIGSDTAKAPGFGGPGAQGEGAMANDNIKNLSAKQHQQLMRIIRQYSKGQLTEQAAKTLLRTGLNLSEEDINSVLGIQVAMSSDTVDVIAMFDECGDAKGDFEVIKSKRVSFSQVEDIEEDESLYMAAAFKTYDLTTSEKQILDLIKKDSKITPEIIAKAIGQTKAYVTGKIKNLSSRGLLESATELIGEDEVIVRKVPKGSDVTAPPPVGNTAPAQIFIKYSYEGPQDSKNRPFCAKLMALDRLYSRKEIETISARLGYSVFDRRGGFWNDSGVTKAHCRHDWKSNIVVKKGGATV